MRSANILIIDDEVVLHRIVITILEADGYEARAAYSVAQALELIAECQPSLVLCDLMMPEASGLDFLRFCRDTPKMAGIPVIIITTAYGADDLIREAHDLGAYDVLNKPFSRAQLINRINSALGVGGQ